MKVKAKWNVAIEGVLYIGGQTYDVNEKFFHTYQSDFIEVVEGKSSAREVVTMQDSMVTKQVSNKQNKNKKK